MTLASSFKTRRWALTACAVSALLLAGCASLQPQTPEQIVEARANQRWQYLIEGDIQKAYDMLTDSFRRVTPYERYRSRMANGGWIKAKAISVTCADEVCSVRISLEAKPPLAARYGGNINTGLDESWVLEEGQWRIKPQL